jgi:N-acetylglucosamine transport system permease protein
MNRDKLKQNLKNNLLRFFLIIISLLVLIPIFWAVLSSFKNSQEYLSSPWGFPKEWHFENYINAINKANMGLYFLNSIFVTAISLSLLTFLVIPASYALARFEFFGSKFINTLIMAGLFISANYIVVPLFMILKNLNGLNSRIWIAIVYTATGLPFYIFLLSSFMGGISKEYEDAASIDGCGYISTLYKIIVPMVKPGLVTVLLFGFMTCWNEYMIALTVISDPLKRTLPVGLKNLMEMQKYATDWGAMFAGLVLVMLPTIIFYIFVQKKLTSGLSIGGIKG